MRIDMPLTTTVKTMMKTVITRIPCGMSRQGSAIVPVVSHPPVDGFHILPS